METDKPPRTHRSRQIRSVRGATCQLERDPLRRGSDRRWEQRWLSERRGRGRGRSACSVPPPNERRRSDSSHTGIRRGRRRPVDRSAPGQGERRVARVQHEDLAQLRHGDVLGSARKASTRNWTPLTWCTSDDEVNVGAYRDSRLGSAGRGRRGGSGPGCRAALGTAFPHESPSNSDRLLEHGAPLAHLTDTEAQCEGAAARLLTGGFSGVRSLSPPPSSRARRFLILRRGSTS
jgi:hypothetical protein